MDIRLWKCINKNKMGIMLGFIDLHLKNTIFLFLNIYVKLMLCRYRFKAHIQNTRFCIKLTIKYKNT